MLQVLFLGSVLASPLLVLLIGVYLVRLYDVRSNRTKYRFYALTFPSELRLDQVIDWWASVASTFAHSTILPSHGETIVIELRSDAHGLTHRLGIPWQHTELLGQLRAHLTGVHIVEHKLEKVPTWTHAVEVGVSDSSRQLDVEKIEAQARRILTAATAEMKADDALAIQLVINPAGRVKRSEPLGQFLGLSKPNTKEEAEQLAKRAQNQFKMVLRVVASSTTLPHAKKLVSNVRNAYRALNNSHVHLTPTMTRRRKIIENFNRAAAPMIYPGQVSALELSALSGFPIGAPPIPGLTLGRTRYLPPNETILRDGRRLGLSYQDRPVAISPVDACRHTYWFGPSGLGKSTALTNGKQQDIERGDGVVSIETKDRAQFLADLNTIPPERVGDAIVMDFTDQDWPVGFNVLQGGNINNRVDELTRIFARGDGDIYFRDIMYHGLHTLAHYPELTLVDLIPFLMPRNPMEKAWRESLINRLPKNSEFHHYWKSFDQLKATEQRQRIQPVLNRLWEVTNRRDLRNTFGQSDSTIDFREVMRDNKLLFIYIPDSLGSETISILTSLLFKELWNAVREVKKDRPTHLYLDEAQRLRNVDLAEVLSLARSFKYGLNLANQYRSQLPQETQAALTNIATIAAFKLDGPDAQWMQSMMGKSVTADDFMNLGPHEVIAKVGINGGSSAPTWFKTLAPFKPHGRASDVRANSRRLFSTPAKKVDEAILRRHSAPATPPKAKPTFGDMKRGEE